MLDHKTSRRRSSGAISSWSGWSDFRKGMIWITHFMNQRNCFAVMNHQLCEATSTIFTKQSKNEVISQYELAVGQEGVHPFWPLVREGEHFLNNSKDGKDGMKKNDVLGTSLPLVVQSFIATSLRWRKKWGSINRQKKWRKHNQAKKKMRGGDICGQKSLHF